MPITIYFVHLVYLNVVGFKMYCITLLLIKCEDNIIFVENKISNVSVTLIASIDHNKKEYRQKLKLHYLF